MSDECVNLNEVLERVQHDQELLLELFEIFLDDCPKKVVILRAALRDNNQQQIKDVAHSMKGASGNIAAKKLNATLITIEQLAKENKLEEIKSFLPQLETQLSELKEYYSKLQDQFKS